MLTAFGMAAPPNQVGPGAATYAGTPAGAASRTTVPTGGYADYRASLLNGGVSGGSGTFASGKSLTVQVPPEACLAVTWNTGATATIQPTFRSGGNTGQARTGPIGGKPFYYSGAMYESVTASAADANISWEVVPDLGYPPFDTAGGTGGTDISLPGGATAGSPTPIDALVKNDTELKLGKGFYSWNMSSTALISGGTVSRFKMHGVHGGANATSGTVITVTLPPVAADTLDFIDTEWWNLTFTCVDTTLNAGMFVGYGCVRNYMHDNLFIDFAPSIVYRHGLQYRFQRNLIRTSGSPPAHVNSNVFDCLSLWAQDNDVDFNSTTMQGAGQNVMFGASGASTAGQSFQEYWVERNLFFVGNAAGHGPGSAGNVVVALDLEAGQSTVPPTEVWFAENDCWNCNVDINSGTDVWVLNNRANYTSTSLASGSVTNPFQSFVYVIATGSARTLDQIHIEGNTVYQADAFNAGAPNTPSVVAWTCIKIDSGFSRGWVRGNTLIGNGSGTAPTNGGGLVQVSIANATSGTIGFLDVADNVFGMTTDPGANVHAFAAPQTASSTVTVGDLHSAETFAQVYIRRNTLSAAQAATYQAPAIAINGFAFLVNIGIATKTTTITDLQVTDNDCSAYTPATGSWTPSNTTPFLLTTNGTQSVAGFRYFGNTPRLSNLIVGVGVQQTPVVQVTIPAGFPSLSVRVSGMVNITTPGTESFGMQYIFTPETSGAAQTQALEVQTPNAGTFVTTTINAAGAWVSRSAQLRVKANTNVKIQTNAGTYTGPPTFDVLGEIEIL